MANNYYLDDDVFSSFSVQNNSFVDIRSVTEEQRGLFYKQLDEFAVAFPRDLHCNSRYNIRRYMNYLNKKETLSIEDKQLIYEDLNSTQASRPTVDYAIGEGIINLIAFNNNEQVGGLNIIKTKTIREEGSDKIIEVLPIWFSPTMGLTEETFDITGQQWQSDSFIFFKYLLNNYLLVENSATRIKVEIIDSYMGMTLPEASQINHQCMDVYGLMASLSAAVDTITREDESGVPYFALVNDEYNQ